MFKKNVTKIITVSTKLKYSTINITKCLSKPLGDPNYEHTFSIIFEWQTLSHTFRLLGFLFQENIN